MRCTSTPSPALLLHVLGHTPGPQAAEEAACARGLPCQGGPGPSATHMVQRWAIPVISTEKFVWLSILFQRSRRPQSDGKWLRHPEVPNSWQLPGAGCLKTSRLIGSTAPRGLLTTFSLPGRRGDRAEWVAKPRKLPFASS